MNRNHLESIAVSARDSYQIIERWKKQKVFDERSVETLIARIVKLGPGYYSAIHLSIDTAAKSSCFAESAMATFGPLIQQEDSLPDLVRGLQDVIVMADNIKEAAKDTKEHFRKIRMELYKISKDIPNIISSIDSGRKTGKEETCSDPGQSHDHLHIVTEDDDDGQAPKSVVSQLEYAKKDIDTLISYVTSFINWWSKITTYLNNPQVVLLQIRLDGTLYFPADSVKELLVTLSKGYIQYSEQIREIENCFLEEQREEERKKADEKLREEEKRKAEEQRGTNRPGSRSTFEAPENTLNGNDLDTLARSARKSFQIIEWWKNEKIFDERPVEVMVDRIVKQGPAYYSAIYKSADTAEKGCFFAKDAVAFCERLITQSDPLSDLVRGLQDIIEIADQAKKGAEDMRGQFRKIRVELFEIAKDIPGITASIKSNSKPSKDSSSSQTNGNHKRKSGRYDEDVLKVLVSQFERAKEDIGELVGHVTTFVDWWADITTSLKYLETILPQIRVDGSNPFRTGTVKKQWVAVFRKYVSYRDQIYEVADYYIDIAKEYIPDWKAQQEGSSANWASEIAKLDDDVEDWA